MCKREWLAYSGLNSSFLHGVFRGRISCDAPLPLTSLLIDFSWILRCRQPCRVLTENCNPFSLAVDPLTVISGMSFGAWNGHFWPDRTLPERISAGLQ